MKPSDLYLSSRHVFGFLLPGALWALALIHILKFDDLSFQTWTLLSWLPMQVGWVRIAVFVFVSLILGFVWSWPSFWIARLIENRNLYETMPQGRLTNLYLEKLRNDVYLRLTTYWWQIPEITQPEAGLTKRDRTMFSLCKGSIICRSPELGRSLLEIEDEINLYGMMALPVLAYGFIISLHGFSSVGIWVVFVRLLFLAGTTFYLVMRFCWCRIAEEQTCYQHFLLIESGLSSLKDKQSYA